MRVRSFVFVATTSLLALSTASPAWPKSPILDYSRTQPPDLVRARELDAQGVRAYREGRPREALLLFTEAYRLGGPSLELWNVARCHQRLDEGDDAAEVLTRYLDADDLLAGDRFQATRELAELRRKPSTVIVDSAVTGAPVFVDGRRAGVAPVAFEVAAGRHVIRVEAGGRSRDVEVEARYGRPIVLRGSSVDDDVADPIAEAPVSRRLEIDLQGSAFAHQLGAVAARVGPGITMGARFGVVRGSVSGFIALRGEAYGFGWSSSVADVSPPGCTLSSRYKATGMSGVLGGGFAWDASRVVRASLELGVGAEGLLVERGGGDVLLVDCSPSPAMVPVGSARAEVSFRVSGGLRFALTPLAFAVHPAYDNARMDPRDASGAWVRLGASLGLAYDVRL